MPTPVPAARPCLADDSSAALDAAVAAARRRHHAQTTSLHVIFALLSPSSPPLLRHAVSRLRHSRLQLKALELCFAVALDRLPAAPPPPPPPAAAAAAAAAEPPVSNSLMAAIKRSQAHQRRNPDTFHLYQQYNNITSSSTSSFSGVKVELQQLILAVLDDPVVSRVFGDAGFRSCDIKLAVLRPPLLRLPRRPPLFLCSFGEEGPRGFPFPFPPQLETGEENSRRIAEVIVLGKNPVLVGVGAADAARDFGEAVQQRNCSVLPPELQGVRFVEVDRCVPEGLEVGGGVVVSVGDLKELVEGDGGGDLVPELTRVLERNQGRVWVMGWSATYEGYMKFLSRYPSRDKAWDLQLLPITSLRPAMPVMGGFLPRSQSMMESIVPFGGFFPAAYEPKVLLSKPHQSPGRCQNCNENYEQEVAGVQSGCIPSVGNQHQISMPAWMRKAEMVTTNHESESPKAKDDRSILSAKVMDLQRKWDANCQRLHRGSQIRETDTFQMHSNVSLQYGSPKERASKHISKNLDPAQGQSSCANVLSLTTDLQITKASQSISLPLTSGGEDTDLISKLQLRLSKSEQLQTEGFRSHRGAPSELFVHVGSDLSSSATSVTTDLVLGTPDGTPRKEVKSASIAHVERLKDLSECVPSKKVDEFSSSIPDVIRHSYPCSPYQDTLVKDKYLPMHTHLNSKMMSTDTSAYGSRCPGSSDTCKPFDPTNFKMLYRSLIGKVGRQEEALRAISEAVVSCKAGHGRRQCARPKGDIWLNFLGHDRIGQKRAAMALAELICGSKENFICIDLGSQDGCHQNTICYQQGVNEFDVRFRGKTIVDHIAEEVRNNPWSVVFIENVNKADCLVQTSLSQAIHNGKLSDSYGREFNINNAIFVTTATITSDKTFSPGKESIKFSEERILGAQGWKMKLLLESISESASHVPSFDVSITSSPFVNKRKLDVSADNREQHEFIGTLKRTHRSFNTFLDLNLPVEEASGSDADCSSGDESNSMSGNSEAWLEEFFNLMDETVHFKQFDFDGLADRVLKEINKILRTTSGCKCTLEIDVKAMEQILAATWLLEDVEELNNWLQKVFVTGLLELRQRYNHSTRISLKLIAWDGVPMDPAPGILLPSRIIVE